MTKTESAAYYWASPSKEGSCYDIDFGSSLGQSAATPFILEDAHQTATVALDDGPTGTISAWLRSQEWNEIMETIHAG